MINIIDYFFGLIHYFINDQLNITYVMKLSNSPELNNLKKELEGKISGMNKFYRNLYKPYLLFDKILQKKKIEEVCLSTESKYYNLDLRNYELIKLVCIKHENETEFIFTASHIIMDSVSIIAFVHYLLQGYSLDKITSYINFPEIIKKYHESLKERNIRKSVITQLARYIKRGKKDKNKRGYITFRKKDDNLRSAPCMMKASVDMNTVKKMAEKYGLSRGNYMTLKLVKTIFNICPNEAEGNACLLNITKNLRLTPLNFTDEPLGNYVTRRFIHFDRPTFLSFSDYVDCYNEKLTDKSYIDDLFHEFYHFQKLSRAPRFMIIWIFKKIFAKPSEGAPSLNIAASFSYLPVNLSILFPQDVLKKLCTNLLEFACYFRVFKRHSPCFFVFPDNENNFQICLAFNEAFMDTERADKFLDLYKKLLMEG